MKQKKVNYRLIFFIAVTVIFLLIAIFSPKKYSVKDIEQVSNTSFSKGYDYGYLVAYDDMMQKNFTQLCNLLLKFDATEAYTQYCTLNNCQYIILTPENKTDIWIKTYYFEYPKISGYCRNMEDWCKDKNFTYFEGELNVCYIKVE